MSQVNIHIDPLSTSCVLKYLGLAIEEIKLVRSIDNLNEQVRLSRSLEFEPGRHRYLISELRFLNNQLRTLREYAKNQ
ncbi:MAG TPA: hypothetical protein VKB27_12840 [Gammaproteobacteria bacterium]|nr:hypothetical protein [Gammaproteobacteria bacterium]